MPNSTISITVAQSQQLQTLRDQGNYSAAYSYLRDIIESNSSNDQRAANWFDKAASINANDSSFISEFVRNATMRAALGEGEVVTSVQFQEASDALAVRIIDKIVDGKKILPFDEVIKLDVNSVVDELRLQPQGWAGASMALIPYLGKFNDNRIGGLGLTSDSPFFTELFKEYRNAPNSLIFFNGGLLFKELLDNNLSGLANATESQLIQAFDASIDYINGTIDPNNSFLSSLKTSLNQSIQSAHTLHTITQAYLNSLHTAEASSRPPRVDPLTLDLDGDGIELVSVTNSTTFFDLDVTQNANGSYISDGVKEQVGWIKSDDALLTLDKNNNGTIDNILELFGKQNKTGTEELREYDLNNIVGANGIADGIINNQDNIFNQLKLWQDLNQDGLSQTMEIRLGTMN